MSTDEKMSQKQKNTSRTFEAIFASSSLVTVKMKLPNFNFKIFEK